MAKNEAGKQWVLGGDAGVRRSAGVSWRRPPLAHTRTQPAEPTAGRQVEPKEKGGRWATGRNGNTGEEQGQESRRTMSL